MSVDRQLLAGMVARAVSLTMLTEVGDVWAGRRHEPADPGRGADGMLNLGNLNLCNEETCIEI